MNNPSVEDFLKGAADDRAEEWDWDDHSWGASGWNDGDRWRDHQWQGPRSWSNGREFDDYGRRTSWDTSWEGGSTETTASAHGGSWGYQGGHDDHDEEPHDPWADGRDPVVGILDNVNRKVRGPSMPTTTTNVEAKTTESSGMDGNTIQGDRLHSGLTIAGSMGSSAAGLVAPGHPRSSPSLSSVARTARTWATLLGRT